MRKSISILLLAGALASTAAMADSSRAVLGGALGGAAGAAIGYNVNGRDGALVGAALGGLVGVAASSRHDGYHRNDGYYRGGSSYSRYEGPRVIRREVIVERPRYYYPPERVVYVPRGHYDRGWDRRYDSRWDRHDRWERHDRWDRHSRWD
ncbi:YMGG-like glycine zipper-containing protein [Chitinimonas naiadis]